MVAEGVMLLHRNGLTINNISEIKDYTLIYTLGGTTSFYTFSGIDINKNRLREVSGLDIERAIKILTAGHADFYAYDLTAVESYLKKNRASGIKKIAIPMDNMIDYLIFSKKSKFYRSKPNPAYNPDKDFKINNLPYTLDEKCMAYKLQQTLKSMKKSGEIEKIRNKLQQKPSHIPAQPLPGHQDITPRRPRRK